MITAWALTASLLTWNVASTVWWNTPGGRVTEQHDATHAECTMTLYDAHREVAFTWGRNQPFHGIAAQPGWDFPADMSMRVALQFGDHRLSDRTALGGGESVAFMIDQPIDELLMNAGSIAVDPGSAVMAMPLPPASRMASLVSAAQRCRRALALPPS